MSFDIAKHIHRMGTVDQINGQSWFAEAACSSDTVQVRLAVGVAAHVDRKVEINDNGYLKLTPHELRVSVILLSIQLKWIASLIHRERGLRSWRYLLNVDTAR